MEVICLEDAAFYQLVETVLKRIQKEPIKEERWILTDEAMKILGITSRTTLQKLRDEGKIAYSQPARKNILYDRESIKIYLEKHIRKTF